jgi:acid phosphatase (class A)
MIKRTLALALLLVPLSLANPFAGNAQASDQSARYTFMGITLDYPPAPGSPANLEDERVLRLYQANRTEAECKQAEYENTVNLNNLYGPETGVLSAEEVASVNSEAKKIINQVGLITAEFKFHFGRLRPYEDYAGLSPCISKPWDSYGGLKMSYPSSYASISTVLNVFLTKQFPAKAELIEKQSEQLCRDRVLGGVHHPSDIEAGLDLGRQIVKKYNY